MNSLFEATNGDHILLEDVNFGVVEIQSGQDVMQDKSILVEDFSNILAASNSSELSSDNAWSQIIPDSDLALGSEITIYESSPEFLEEILSSDRSRVLSTS